MLLIPSQLQRLACRALVPALLLWLGGGAGILSCCAANVEAATYRQDAASRFSARVADDSEASHCAAQMEHCHTEQSRANALSEASSCQAHKRFIGMMPCCSRAGQALDRARKSRIAPERADSQPAAKAVSAPQRESRAGWSAFTARIYDGSETYLRACVFLI